MVQFLQSKNHAGKMLKRYLFLRAFGASPVQAYKAVYMGRS